MTNGPSDRSPDAPPDAPGSAPGAPDVPGEATDTSSPDTSTPDPPTPGPAIPDDLAGPVARSRDVLDTARTQAVRGEDRWPEAGRKVLRLHFARMLARVPGAIAGDDPEDVHAMRVASRRMRAAWRVYGDGFDRDATRRYRDHLRDVGGHLGAVRDRDVLIGILDDLAERHGPRATRGLLPLRVAWVAEREEARRALAEHLASEVFVGFVAEHEAFLAADASDPVASEDVAAGRVRMRMPAVAWAGFASVIAFEAGLATTDLATLHRLRIAGKWYRYTLESVREALDGDATALIAPVVALQDHLGDQHDRHVAATLAREFLAAAPGTTAKETAQVERFTARLDDRVEWLGRRLDRAWDPFAAPAYRARLGRALGRL